ncbi:MAG: AAA family ATPase [Pseudomonadota bacterium]
MYAQFFGLTHEPFSIAPDPRYLFMSERHREALAHLLYGVGGGGGFVLLSGEIGTGKTTVCRCFLEQIPANCNVAYIFNPKLTAQELLRSVCDEFHVPYHAADLPGAPSAKDYVDALNGFLLQAHADGRNSVLIIDEAQMLSADVLEQLRLLTNLETNERKLLQIMLIGQPELRAMLARPELEQLSQRVIARFHLDALTEAETEQYIQHRLSVAGLTGAMPFDRKALKRIHQLTRGVPRRINLLCDRAMLGAYATGKAVIDRRIIDKAAGEVFESASFAPRGTGAAAGPGAGKLVLGALAGATCTAAAVAIYFAGPFGHAPGLASTAARPASAPSAPAVAASAAAAAASAAAPAATATPAESAAASAAAAAPGPAAPPDLKSSFAMLAADEDAALRQLAEAWALTLPPGDACEAAARSQVQCFRQNGSLDTLRKLDRPVVLALQDDSGAQAFAVMTGLHGETATLRTGSTTLAAPLSALAGMWQGNFRTLWRAPSGYTLVRTEGSKGPTVDWLAQRLAVLDKRPAPPPGRAMDARLRSRLQSFQLANGLAPDGRAGPLTMMLLNRATGVDEPRLATN